MRLAGLRLLLSGWVVAIAALCLLREPAQRGAFVAAGVLVELLGLFLLGRAHRASLGERS